MDDLEGLEMTLEILGDTEAVARISESLAALGRGEPGADLATRVGKPLFGPLAGCHGALRGTYRIVYRIEENTRTVHILDIDHRAGIYRPHS